MLLGAVVTVLARLLHRPSVAGDSHGKQWHVVKRAQVCSATLPSFGLPAHPTMLSAKLPESGLHFVPTCLAYEACSGCGYIEEPDLTAWKCARDTCPCLVATIRLR
jgi:hypothetical protein